MLNALPLTQRLASFCESLQKEAWSVADNEQQAVITKRPVATTSDALVFAENAGVQSVAAAHEKANSKLLPKGGIGSAAAKCVAICSTTAATDIG